MKNLAKLIGLIALMVVTGLSFVACKKDALHGTTWKANVFGTELEIKFDGQNCTILEDGDEEGTGKYSISGNTILFPEEFDIDDSIGTLDGDTLSLMSDGVTITFTKQAGRKSGGGKNISLPGTTWKANAFDTELEIKFTRQNCTILEGGDEEGTGKYSVSGNTILFPEEFDIDGNIGTLDGDTLSLRIDGVTLRFTKQAGGKSSGGKNISLEGVWLSKDGLYLDFNGPFFGSSNVIYGGGGYDYHGNYTISGNRVTVTFPGPEPGNLTGTISGNVLTVVDDYGGGGTFKKQ